jgi:tetratricopeptide (TPR) repeat protein
MLLQRCTNKAALVALLLIAMVMAGCGGSAPVRDTGTDDMSQGGRGDSDSSQTVREDPTAGIPPVVLTLFEQATASMASGDFVDAELRFKEFLLQYPGYPGAHVNLAIIHASNGNEGAARASVDAALALEANHPAALNQLGMLLRRNGKFLDAESAYLKAVTVSPEYALAHYNLGVLNELYLQRLEAALQHFETYQSLVGEDKQVAKWIKDLTRRVAANQRTANAAD